MVKAMLGTGLLSLPLAFKHAGLWLGVILMVILCGICLYCMRLVVYAAHYICRRNGTDVIDYANVMRSAVESGPTWISIHGYFFKQLLNINMFCAQLGFCCIYFVFMADNIKSFFDMNTMIHLPKSIWMALLLIPILSICSIRRLNKLAPFAFVANCLYLYFTGGKSYESTTTFIKWNGVLNCSCLVVMTIFAMMGFYGYLAVGDEVADTITLNVPQELKIPIENQTVYIYFARYGIVLLTCAIAELIPHLALFISFIGAFSGSSMALLFPPFIDLLVSYSRGKLVLKVWIIDLTLLFFAMIGLFTGTYTALVEIFKKIGRPI
ncbi:Transmembrane amino acid transporter protein [Dirofilaria immitis]|nr:Transmembrane amino acid transporter protein [Dirofilaria immitis]